MKLQSRLFQRTASAKDIRDHLKDVEREQKKSGAIWKL